MPFLSSSASFSASCINTKSDLRTEHPTDASLSDGAGNVQRHLQLLPERVGLLSCVAAEVDFAGELGNLSARLGELVFKVGDFGLQKARL
eukprot:scaffold80170_cov43-Prasinocladus_malaysianus.AAC.1